MKPNKTNNLEYYWVKFKEGNFNKIVDVKPMTETFKKSGYCFLRGKTIKHWNKMDLKAKLLSMKLDNLWVSAAGSQSKSETDKLIKDITNIVSE